MKNWRVQRVYLDKLEKLLNHTQSSGEDIFAIFKDDQEQYVVVSNTIVINSNIEKPKSLHKTED